MNTPALSPAQRAAWRIAAASWLALLLLTVLWEWLLAPLRPGGSWLVLKGLPLLLPLAGVLRGDVRVMQWALLLVLAYIAEGGVRAADPPPAGTLAMVEIALGLAFFAAAIVYLRPFKKAARARTRK
jgi:uncharacterized membrane protein